MVIVVVQYLAGVFFFGRGGKALSISEAFVTCFLFVLGARLRAKEEREKNDSTVDLRPLKKRRVVGSRAEGAGRGGAGQKRIKTT